jgi:hypothetical protein
MASTLNLQPAEASLLANAFGVGFIDLLDGSLSVSTKVTTEIEVQCALLPIGSLESHDVVWLASVRTESLIHKLRPRIMSANISILPLYPGHLIGARNYNSGSV